MALSAAADNSVTTARLMANVMVVSDRPGQMRVL
jgi:hypothetical protein